MRIATFLMGVGCLVLFCAGSAAAFSYDEGVSGDLDDRGDPLVFEFTLGENSISGTRSFTDSVGSDHDLFGFTIPLETEIQSVRFTYQILAEAGYLEYLDINSEIATVADDGNWIRGNSAISTIYSLDDPVSPSPSTLHLANVGNASNFPYAPTLPLAGGPFVWISDLTAVHYDEVSISWSYTYTFTVVPVGSTIPEPTSGVLVGLGLVALAVRRARPRSRRRPASDARADGG